MPSLLDTRTGINFETPEVTKLRPQERAKRLFGSEDAWGRASAAAAVDVDLSDQAFRLLAMLAVDARRSRFVEIGYDNICWARNCSKMTAIRLAKELEEKGYVRIVRKHNSRNIFELRESIFAREEPEEPGRRQANFVTCSECRLPCRAVGKTGICRTCVRLAADVRKYRTAARRLGTDDHDRIAAKLGAEATSAKWLKIRSKSAKMAA